MSDPVKFITDFEDISIPGKRYLRESLTNCADSIREIEEFQRKNGIILPSLRPMLPLLDLHGVRRLEFHQSVMEELRDKLINRIEEISTKMDSKDRDKKLKELLHKSFPLIKIATLQPVVMSLLKNVDVVEDKYLKLLVADRSLYEKCDVNVKRHIWQEHQTLFGDEVSPLLIKYIKEKEQTFANISDPLKTFFALSPKTRRQNEVLQTLAKMVGRNVLLYDTILQFLRTIFLHTSNPHYCTLRVSLLMELHDANVTDIITMDPCHKFAWCLDACIRETRFESKRVRELQGMLDHVAKSSEAVIGDMAMALCDPYALNFICSCIVRICYSLITSEQMPREHTHLQFLLRLVNLGLHAYDILKSQQFKEPKMDPAIVTKFIPILMSFMVDDQVRAVNSKLPPDDRESALTIIEHCGPPPDLFQNYVTNDRLAAVLAIYYAAQAAKNRDRQAVVRVFGTLSSAHDARTFADQYLHILVAGLICLGEEFANEELCAVIFDEIFLPAFGHGSTVLHLMKLVWHVYPHLAPARLSALMRTIESYVYLPNTSEVLKQLYKELEERIAKVGQTDKDKESAATAAPGTANTAATGATTTTSTATPTTPTTPIIAHQTPGHPMLTPGYAAMSPSPNTPSSPVFYPQSPGPFSPMSPMPYQSPFHHMGSGSGSGAGGSSGGPY